MSRKKKRVILKKNIHHAYTRLEKKKTYFQSACPEKSDGSFLFRLGQVVQSKMTLHAFWSHHCRKTPSKRSQPRPTKYVLIIQHSKRRRGRLECLIYEVLLTQLTKAESIRAKMFNRPFPLSTLVRSNNTTKARSGWTFSYIYCIFVHSDLDLALLFVGMREVY